MPEFLLILDWFELEVIRGQSVTQGTLLGVQDYKGSNFQDEISRSWKDIFYYLFIFQGYYDNSINGNKILIMNLPL